MQTCRIEGCEKAVFHKGHGLCSLHNGRRMRTGDPLALTRIVLFGHTLSERLWMRVDRTGDGCWEWQGHRQKQGYGQIAVDRGQARWRSETAHRVAWELVYGPIPDGMQVRHYVCDNPPCCKVTGDPETDHLRLGSAGDNAADRHGKGRDARGDRSGPHAHPERMARGERVNTAKLNADDVRTIRARYAAGGVTLKGLAAEYGVVFSNISRIVRRLNWRHIS